MGGWCRFTPKRTSIPIDDFELCVFRVVCPSPGVAPTFAVATASRSGGLVGALTFEAAPTARSGRLMEALHLRRPPPPGPGPELYPPGHKYLGLPVGSRATGLSRKSHFGRN